MHRREDDHHCAATISYSAAPDIIRRLQDYQRGYADGQAERGSR